MRLTRVLLLTVMGVLNMTGCAVTSSQHQTSLAPPHDMLVEGQPVPVSAHPDQRSLLEHPDPLIANNKQRVYDYWRTVILAGQAGMGGDFLAENYQEHNPLLPSGREAFLAFVSDQRQPGIRPDSIDGLVSLVAENNLVVMTLVSAYPEPDGSGEYTSTQFEMFRLENGRIAEHWDSSLFRAGQQVPDFGESAALPVRGLQGREQYPLLDAQNPLLMMNKRLVFDLWRHIPEGGREELAALYLGPDYIQHNPNAVTGRDGFVEYFARRPDGNVESWLETPLVAMVAEGDMVVQVLETEREQGGIRYKVPWFDMFRIADGVVVEHWDSAAKGEIPAARAVGPLGL